MINWELLLGRLGILASHQPPQIFLYLGVHMTATELVREAHEQTNLTGHQLAYWISQNKRAEAKSLNKSTIKAYCYSVGSPKSGHGKRIVKRKVIKSRPTSITTIEPVIVDGVPKNAVWEVTVTKDPENGTATTSNTGHENAFMARLNTLKELIGTKGILTLLDAN